TMSNACLRYSPKARLTLKLFAFLGASKLETRHESHKKQYRKLLNLMRGHIDTGPNTSPEEVLQSLEHLFLGFQGIGQNRTWCAQSFLPASLGLIGGESIWQETQAKREPPSDWSHALSYFRH